MELLAISAVLFVLFFTGSIPEPTAAIDREQFEQAKQSTFDMCQYKAQLCFSASTDGRFCDIVNLNENALSAQDCVVKSKCTQSEFDNLKNVACGPNGSNNATAQEFDDARNATSAACQDAAQFCFSVSGKAQELQRDEKFCDLMDINEEGHNTFECLTYTCSQSQIDKACIAEQFQDAVDATSGNCQVAAGPCFTRSEKAQQYRTEEKVCDLVNLEEDGQSSRDCLVGGGCTESEFDNIKKAACGDGALAASGLVLLITIVNVFIGII